MHNIHHRYYVFSISTRFDSLQHFARKKCENFALENTHFCNAISRKMRSLKKNLSKEKCSHCLKVSFSKVVKESCRWVIQNQYFIEKCEFLRECEKNAKKMREKMRKIFFAKIHLLGYLHFKFHIKRPFHHGERCV